MAAENGNLDAFKVPLTVWRRPEHLLEPKILHRENGIVVRDVTPDLDPFVVDFMVYLQFKITYFIYNLR